MGLCTRPALQHHWSIARISPGHCWDIAAMQPGGSAPLEPAARGQDAASTGHCVRDTADSAQRAELWSCVAQVARLSEWLRTQKAALVQGGNPRAPPG